MSFVTSPRLVFGSEGYVFSFFLIWDFNDSFPLNSRDSLKVGTISVSLKYEKGPL